MFGLSREEFDSQVERQVNANMRSVEVAEDLRKQISSVRTAAFEARGRARHNTDDINVVTETLTQLSRQVNDIDTKLNLMIDFYNLEIVEHEPIHIPARTEMRKRPKV